MSSFVRATPLFLYDFETYSYQWMHFLNTDQAIQVPRSLCAVKNIRLSPQAGGITTHIQYIQRLFVWLRNTSTIRFNYTQTRRKHLFRTTQVFVNFSSLWLRLEHWIASLGLSEHNTADVHRQSVCAEVRESLSKNILGEPKHTKASRQNRQNSILNDLLQREIKQTVQLKLYSSKQHSRSHMGRIITVFSAQLNNSLHLQCRGHGFAYQLINNVKWFRLKPLGINKVMC